MAVPYTFGNATTSIPLSQLDSNFATAITLGNTAVYLGNTTTTLGNLTLTNVTLSSGTSNLASTSIANGTSNVSVVSSGGNITMATAGSNAVIITTGQNVGIGTTTPGYKLETSGSIYANGIEVGFNGDSIRRAGDLYVGTTGSNSLFLRTNTTNAISINSSQQFGFAGSVGGNFGSQASFYNPGSNSWCAEFNTGVNGNLVLWQRTSTYPCTQIQFYGFNGAVATNAGNITLSNSTTASYNTSSDYRMKENVQPMTGALAKVALLKPVVYKWKAEFGGQDGQGFIAHELQEVVPDCVTGKKDAVDDKGEPQYQGVDTSFLVATLVASIQELKALVDAQATEIAELKAKVGA